MATADIYGGSGINYADHRLYCLRSLSINYYALPVSWLSRGPDSSGEVWIGCKRLILKLSKVLSVKGVKGPYMHPNQRLIPI
jgi:hypothetical protein